MTSRHETEVNPENEPKRHPQQALPPTTGSEAAYDRLTGYGFARRYVKGKIVADIGHEEVGYGSRLLAQTAESVVALAGSPGSTDSASALYPAPNITYRRVDLPELPYPEDHFDVVVAFGVVEDLEHPEEFLGEARRVLKKEDGVLLLSIFDKRADINGGDRRGMYVAELRELVGRHFGSLRIYRQGAVAGGFVFPDTAQEETSSEEAVTVEVVQFSLDEPGLARLGAQPPTTRSVIAVCGGDGDEALGQEEKEQGVERAYLLLDHDRGVFEESEDLAEDMELMLGEIEQMQQSEVQAFVEAIRVQRQQNLAQLQMRYLFHLRSYLGHRRNVTREQALHARNVIRGDALQLRNVILENILHRRNIIYGNIYALRQKGVKGSVKGALRRSAALYRRLAAKDGNPD